MAIIARHMIDGALKQHAAARKPMQRWLAIAELATWNDISEARATFPTADAIKGTPLTCFNIAGNSYRLITIVSYQRQEIVIRELLRHAEYTRKYVK